MRILPALLLVLITSTATVGAAKDIYLYSADVARIIDVKEYALSGEIVFAQGYSGSEQSVLPGPAPQPYPPIHVWEQGIERLGGSRAEMDGLTFLNHGTHWVKNRQALVEWRIDIPGAPARLTSEFAEDLTVSLWVDWNQDEMWNKNEAMIRRDINLAEYMPFEDQTVHVYYLTSFRVPDLDEWLSKQVKGDNDRDVLDLWARGVLTYDDPDNSADGEQLFGDVEDYKVRYMKTPRPRAKDDKDG
jgi:hypothetical protein